MPRFFDAARVTGTGVPPIRAFLTDSSAAFIRGAAVVIAADGELEECGADPTKIAGFALAAAQSAPGYQAANNPTVVTGRENRVPVALADGSTIFSCRAVNGGTDPVTPTLTMIGESYGIVKTSDGTWALDIAEVTVKSCTVIDIDITNKVFFVKVNAAFYQFGVAA